MASEAALQARIFFNQWLAKAMADETSSYRMTSYSMAFYFWLNEQSGLQQLGEDYGTVVETLLLILTEIGFRPCREFQMTAIKPGIT